MKRKHPKRLKVEEHHNRFNPSEIITTTIDIPHGPYHVVVEHLGSQESVIVELVYPDGDRLRVESFYYGDWTEDA